MKPIRHPLGVQANDAHVRHLVSEPANVSPERHPPSEQANSELISNCAGDRRGKRLPETVASQARRDELLREAAARFCAGMTHHQAGELLHSKLLRYQLSAWRRDRAATEMPPRLTGRLDALLFQILRTRDAVPGAALIAQVLSRAQR